MGDYKSETVWFIADDDPLFPVLDINDFLNALTKRDQEAGFETHRFDNYSNDHLTHLSPLLACYANPAAPLLNEWQEFDMLALRFHDHKACQRIPEYLDKWESDFLADPRPLQKIVEKELLSFEKAYAPRDLIACVLPEFLRRLYLMNDGVGYHGCEDSPASSILKPIAIRTNTLEAVNQSFGYIKSMRTWMREAVQRDTGVVSFMW